MRLYSVSPPDTPLIALADAKAHLRVDHSDEDELITALVRAAAQHLDGADGVLGRALHQQTWEMRSDTFWENEIRIPLPPLISLDSIQYYDSQNVLRTLSTSAYEVVGVRNASPAFVRPAYSTTWPTTANRSEAVIITFTAGYAINASPVDGTVPEPILQAAKLAVGHWYANRESVLVGVSAQALPMAYEALIAPYRVHYFA